MEGTHVKQRKLITDEATGGSNKVGLADIAQQADASIGTVFNYLNYPDRVSKGMKERISKAIHDLGYVPKSQGRSVMNDQATVGLIMTDISHSLFTSIFEGAQEVCEDNGMELIGANAYSDVRRQSKLLRLFHALGVKGVILCSVNDCEQDLAWAASVGMPVILVDRVESNGATQNCSVLEDNLTAGRLSAQNLLSAGCHNIIMVAHSLDYQSIYNRYLGVQEAIQNQPDVNFSIIDSLGILEQDGYAVGQRISAQQPNEIPDGIITATDSLGIGVIEAIVDVGRYRIPEEIKIVSAEGARTSGYPPVPLSTVQAPGIDMGRKAISLLMDEIENKHHVHGCVLIAPSFITRKSSQKSED